MDAVSEVGSSPVVR